MTSKSFRHWLIRMKLAGIAKSDSECGDLLGVHKNTILHFKANGTDIKTALACAALLARLEPYEAKP